MLQCNETGYNLREILQPFGNRFKKIQPFFIDFLRIQYVGINRAIQFGHHNTLRHKSAEHTHRIGFPLLLRLQYRQRRKNGYIPRFQPFDRRIRLSHRQASVRKINDCVRLYRFQKFEPFCARRHGVNVHSRALKRHNQAVDVGSIAAERIVQSADDGNPGGMFLIEIIFLQISFVFSDLFEGQVFVQVKKHVRRNLKDRIGRRNEVRFAINLLPHITRQTLIVAFVGVVQVASQSGQRYAVEITNGVVGIGCRVNVNGHAPVGNGLKLRALLGGDAHAHAESEYKVIMLESGEMFARYFFVLDKFVGICLDDARPLERLEVY